MKKKTWTLRVWRKEFLRRRIEMSIVPITYLGRTFKDFYLISLGHCLLALLDLKNVLRELRGVLRFIHIR